MKKTPQKRAVEAQTVTCQHCRYERPAADPRCHICGYPWDFEGKARPAKPKHRAK